MTNIQQDTWASLVDLESRLDPEAIRKDTRSKYLGSLVICAIYLGFAAYFELAADKAVVCGFMVNLSVFLLLNQLSKNLWQLFYVLEASKYGAVGMIPLMLYFYPDPDVKRFMYIYTFLFFVFIQDYYQWRPKRFYCFATFSLAASFAFDVTLEYNVTLLCVMLFIAFVSRNFIIIRQENMKLGQMKSSFQVFIKHKNLIDHHVLNGIGKISFHKLMIEKSTKDKNLDTILEETQAIQGELDAIETVLKETDSQQIKEFDLGV